MKPKLIKTESLDTSSWCSAEWRSSNSNAPHGPKVITVIIFLSSFRYHIYLKRETFENNVSWAMDFFSPSVPNTPFLYPLKTSQNVTVLSICDTLRDLVPFVQFKKREKHPWRSVNFSKVAGWSLLHRNMQKQLWNNFSPWE